MTTAHTETPFAIDHCAGRIEIINEETGFTVASISKFADGKLADADAKFIVRACNAHDDLVKALQESNNALKLFADKSKILRDAMQYNNESLAKAGEA